MMIDYESELSLYVNLAKRELLTKNPGISNLDDEIFTNVSEEHILPMIATPETFSRNDHKLVHFRQMSYTEKRRLFSMKFMLSRGASQINIFKLGAVFSNYDLAIENQLILGFICIYQYWVCA